MKLMKVRKGHHSFEIKEPGEYKYELLESGTEVVIGGVFVGKGKERKAVKVEIVHMAAHTRANIVLKGAGYGESWLKFEGKIVVEKNCPDTNSFLTEKILLVGEKARAEAVPDLEIESDDVKCSHAVTVSKIPEEQVFYLRSRGVGEEKAKEMVVEGFLNG